MTYVGVQEADFAVFHVDNTGYSASSCRYIPEIDLVGVGSRSFRFVLKIFIQCYADNRDSQRLQFAQHEYKRREEEY
jgi:hypothetical protein